MIVRGLEPKLRKSLGAFSDERSAPCESFRILFRFQTQTARVLKIQHGRQNTQHARGNVG